MSRVYNFSAGPAVLPEEVLQEAADEMLDSSTFKGYGPEQGYDFLKDNVVGKLKVGDKIIVTGLNKDYIRFKFSNIEYYVNDVSFYEVIKEYKQQGSQGESNQ